MKNSKIAIITPVYNGAHTIEKSIKSLLDQTFKDWINIIINDGSTDETKHILEKYRDEDRFYIIDLEKNIGRGAVRKMALQKAKDTNAKYMCMLDADDLYYQDKLQWQYEYMEHHPDVALLSCSIGYIDDENKLTGVLEVFDKECFLEFHSYKNYIPVPHACSMLRISQIDDVTFDDKLSLGEDQDFMIRMLIRKKYAFVPKIGYLYNRARSFSFKKYKKSLSIDLYAKKKLDLKSFDLLKIYLLNKFKLLYVGIICLLGKESVYFDKIGRQPFDAELNEHKINLPNKCKK
jgi:glycosyltransferase involved in cell wall biosynthesis